MTIAMLNEFIEKILGISGLLMPASATRGATDCSPKARWCVLAHSIVKRGQAIFLL